MGKYSGRESDLPQREHPDGYVPFREPQDMKKMAIVLNIVSLIIIAAFYLLIVLRAQKAIWNIWGILLSLICTIPHEFLHGICFKETVYMYTSLKQGMLFVVGPEDMTKTRFVFMSLLPNIVFGLVPYLCFMINPELEVLGMMGLFSLSMGAGDYMNVYHAITQMPKGALTYLSGFHSFWYLKEN